MNDCEFEGLKKDITDKLREDHCKKQNVHLVNPPDANNICMLETFCTICGVRLIMDENGDYVAQDNGLIDRMRKTKVTGGSLDG